MRRCWRNLDHTKEDWKEEDVEIWTTYLGHAFGSWEEEVVVVEAEAEEEEEEVVIEEEVGGGKEGDRQVDT